MTAPLAALRQKAERRGAVVSPHGSATAPCTVCGANDVRPGPCQPWCAGVRTWLGEAPARGPVPGVYQRWADGHRVAS